MTGEQCHLVDCEKQQIK